MTEQHDKVRVFINALHAKSGGGVTYLRNMLPRLANDERLDIHLLILQDQRAIFGAIAPAITPHEMNFKQTFWRRLLWEQARIPLLARKLGVDITFSPANFGPLLAPGLVILLRNAVEVGRTENRFSKRLYWMALTAMTAVSVIVSRRVIAVSEYAGQTLTFGLSKASMNKVAVIHHGVDPAFTPAAPQPTDPPFLLAVGDLYVQKNFDALIEAFAYVTRSTPRLRLKIAGRPVDSGYRRKVEETVRRFGLAEWVEFLGEIPREELISLYQRCRLFVFPSTVETFGQPLAEAMASGATIVSSQTTAMPEIVGDAALFCDPTKPWDIARKIKTLLADAPLSRELADKALKRSHNFSWDKTAQRTADVLVAANDKTAR